MIRSVFNLFQMTIKLTKLCSCLKQWAQDTQQWWLVQQAVVNLQLSKYWKKSKDQQFIVSIQNQLLFQNYMERWILKQENGLMVFYPKHSELQMKKIKENKNLVGFYMMVMLMLSGLKIWIVSWMTTNYLHLLMVIELDYKSFVKCYLKFLIFSMLRLLQSVDVVWFMLILET